MVLCCNDAETSSVLTKARHKVLQRYFSAEDTARHECVNGFAILLKSVPTAFRTIYHIFSDQELLKTVRHHVKTITTVKEDDGKTIRVTDLARLEDIPILASIVHESLRFRITGVGPRMAMEDVMLSNRYLIKKGCYFMIPGHEMHFDQQIWGDTTNTFDAQRFMKADAKKVPSAAFRGFGGGVNLCPGQELCNG
jgi:cytochrome P450